MFVYKKTEELEKLTAQELDQYKTEMKAHEDELLKTTISDTVKAELKQAKEDLDKATKAIEDLQEKVNELKDANGGQTQVKSLREQLAEQIAEKAEEIKATVKGGFVEIEIKAVASVTTASGANTSPPAITGVQQAPLSNVNLRNVNVLSLTTNMNTNQSAYAYTEAEPKEGGFDYVAEGGTKPQIDLKWTTRYAQPVKVAAWMKLTEESVQDVANLESVAYDFLAKQHALKTARGILFGDGTSPNPKGATVYARAFSAGAMATAVTNPNFMDVVNACITDVFTTHNFTDEMPYMANLVMVSPTDFFLNLVSAKTTDGLPLYPTASLFNQVVIGGVTIVPDELIPAGKIFVADMSKYNTTNYLPYTVKIGWVNDDFIKNQFVILGESRFHAFVKKLDEQAFLYDDIATIQAAIDIANA